MKKLLCLIAVMLLLTACSSDSTDTAAQPEPAEARPAEETVQRSTDADQRTVTGEGSDRMAPDASAANFEQGSAIYQQNCSSCHDAELMGAPPIGHARYSADLEVLVENSIEGIGLMPARGGNPNLDDEEIRAAVEYMVEQSK